jgi:hypothetical protein
MKSSATSVEGKVDRALRAWESSCPEQAFADMTLEQFRQRLQRFFESKAKFAAADTTWSSARQERNTAYAEAVELTKGVVSSVKGHPKYGENSAVYTAMGYVPKSERSSGLTRKRETDAGRRDEESPKVAAAEAG